MCSACLIDIAIIETFMYEDCVNKSLEPVAYDQYLGMILKITRQVLYTGRFIMFSVITNIYNKKTKVPTLMELFTTAGKLKKFFLTTRDVRRVRHG
jgi:hypothetical protein